MDDENSTPESLDDSDYEKREAQFQKRNESLRMVIDILAEYESETIESHGMKAQIAREHDVETHRVHYVLDQWPELVEYRRHANRDPLDPNAVKAAYEDETMKAMAGQGEAVADGASDIYVDVELSLDEVFRSIKLLPGDLGLKFYSQALSADIPRSQIQKILNAEK